MDPVPEMMRCPTCRAEQAWSDTCRRCRSDLRLLKALETEYREHRELCLSNFREGRKQAALEHAQACVRVRPDEAARQLLAVCSLISGDWPAALAAGEGLAGGADG